MLDRIFSDIGTKIKNWAKAYWVIGNILCLIAGIIFFCANEDESITWIGFLIMFGGAITIGISSILLYALGQVVDDIHAIRNKEGTTKEVATKRNAETKAKQKAEEKARRIAEEKAAKLEAEQEQLSISDIENAASAFLNHRISISDITCTLIYVIPQSTGIPKEMHLDMAVGDQEFTSLDLFFDQNRHAYYFKGRHLALDGAWRSEEEIFGFNVNMFKAFTTEVDEDE